MVGLPPRGVFSLDREIVKPCGAIALLLL